MRRNATFAAILTLAAFIAPLSVSAQLGSYNPRPGPQATFFIRNARIVTGSGPEIERGSILVSGGRIQAVGANITAPAGAETIEGEGLSVYPGMMEAGTNMGLSEIAQGANATVDMFEVGSFNPNVQAFYGFNPHSSHIAVTRVVGITHVMSRPSRGILSGQAALMNMSGSTVTEMEIDQRAAMVIELPRSGFGGRGGGGFALAQAGSTQDANRTRNAQIDSLKQILRDAIAYGDAHDAWASDKSLPRPKSDVVLASLVDAARGKQPVLMPADRAADIREAVAFADEMGLKPIIVGGQNALAVASLLKEKNVPVLFSHVMSLPSREDDPYDINFSAPANLVKAGVKVAITSGDAGPESRNLPYTAGMAAAFGLTPADALKAVTLWPAEIMGIGKDYGSIEAGKVANLVITDGDMLEARTQTKYLIIDGRLVPLDSKHEALYREFLNRP